MDTPEKIRDFLLPAIWGWLWEFPDISVDAVAENGCVLIKGFHLKTKKELAFVLTAEDIKTGRWKRIFGPALTALINALK